MLSAPIVPVASATPAGRVRLDPSYNPTRRQRRSASQAERFYRIQAVIELDQAEDDRWYGFLRSVAEDCDEAELFPEELEASRVGHRRGAILRYGVLDKESKSDGYVRRSSRARR